MANVLVVFEASGAVSGAFRELGHNAVSCDLREADPCHPFPAHHRVENAFGGILNEGWDLVIAHPTCTYMAISAAWAFKDPDFDRYPGVGYHQKIKPGTLTGAARRAAREQSLDEVRQLMACPAPRVAIENPIGAISSAIRPPDQIIQPHQFGDDASKQTCLWLKGLPLLVPTCLLEPRMVNGKPRWANQTDSGQNRLSPSEDRWIERSRTYPGIAAAMATQWGAVLDAAEQAAA